MLAKDLDESLIEKPCIIDVDEFSNDEIIQKEKNVFGFYISNHPITKYKAKYNNIVSLNELELYFDKYVNVVVIINRIKKIITKYNEQMIFIYASDEYGQIDIVVFPKFYDLVNDLNINDIVLINGRIEKRMSKYKLILSKMEKL